MFISAIYLFVLIIFGCETNYSKTQWLKITHIYYLRVFESGIQGHLAQGCHQAPGRSCTVISRPDSRRSHLQTPSCGCWQASEDPSSSSVLQPPCRDAWRCRSWLLQEWAFQRQWERAPQTETTEGTPHHVFHIPFIRKEPTSPAHLKWGVYPGHEYQEAGIIGGHLGGCLLQFNFNVKFQNRKYIIIARNSNGTRICSKSPLHLCAPGPSVS